MHMTPTPYRPNTTIVVILVVLLGSLVLFDLVGAAIEWQSWEHLEAGLTYDDVPLTPVVFLAAGQALFQVFAYVLTVVFFCIWVHGANRNARALGAEGMKVTPGWSVGYFFIPILNLFRPFAAVKEIWQASDPDAPSDVFAWRAVTPTPLLYGWWGTWLVTSFVGNAAGRLSLGADSAAEELLASQVTFLSDLVDIPAAILASLVVRDVYLRQQRKHARLCEVQP
jgi:hypothetical protein